MIRISVMSVSKYSAKPAQTPAIFFCEVMRRSRRLGAAAVGPGGGWGAPTGFPHDVQKLAESSSRVPQDVQNM
jgi:hypothetical protein